MTVIIEFFSTLGESILALIRFVIDMVGDLIYFVTLLGELIPVMPAFWTWLPGGLAYTLGLCLSIVVVLRILGRSD